MRIEEHFSSGLFFDESSVSEEDSSSPRGNLFIGRERYDPAEEVRCPGV